MHYKIEYMHSWHIIDKLIKEFLLPAKNTCTPLFYGLPKIHKPGCSLRPVVFGCDGPTDHISAYITHSIQSLTSNLPSHIKDKTFSQLHWETFIFSTQYPLIHSWCHVTMHKHSTQRRHRSRDLLHGGIQASTSHKLSTTPYSAYHTRFHPQI